VTASASAQVTTVRTGDENPMKSIAKSTIYGGATGILLGGTLALVTKGHDWDIVKWHAVAGVYGGFAYGLYHVSRRPPTLGAVHVDDGTIAQVRFPLPGVRDVMGEPGVSVTLLSLRY
jgi:hypothetical protein